MSQEMKAFMTLLSHRPEPVPVCNVTVPLLYYTLARYLVGSARRGRPVTPDVGDSRYDYVVVGGGTSGCVIARRLAELGRWSVALLEAGGEEPDIAGVPAFHRALHHSDVDWGYPVRTLAGRRTWHSGRTLGGTSVVGGMLYLRGHPRDYDAWQAAGNPGWGYSSVLQLFKRSENVGGYTATTSGYHGTDGPLPVNKFPYEDLNVKTLEAALSSAGFKYVDVNGENQEGMMRAHATQKNGRWISACRAFLQNGRPNLTVKLHSRVTKVLFDTNTRQAVGVEYISGVNVGRPVRVYANKEVILTAGVVGSTQLLMLSGVGPSETLKKFNIPVVQDSMVGRNVYDAPEIRLVKFQLKGSAVQVPDQLQGFFLDLSKYVKGKGPLTTPGPSQLVAFTRSSRAKVDGDPPDVQISMSTELASTDVATVTMDDPNCPSGDSSASIPCYYDQLGVSPVLLRPRSRATVSLTSADPLSAPSIRSGYLEDEDDVARAVEAAKLIVNLSRSRELLDAGFEPLPLNVPSCRDWPADSEQWWRCAVAAVAEGGWWGAVGGCGMGPSSDPAVVVDPRLRVHGVTGLRVADVSVAPAPIGAGALATAVMIAEKCAHMIREEWCELALC